MMQDYYAVIMAGGGGTRLWPLSRQGRPKQMLSLFDERSLFQTSIERLKGIFTPDRILVVTIAEQAEELRIQASEIPEENFVIEPIPRGTASVVGLASVALINRNPNAVMAILTADHFIKNEELFRNALKVAYQVALDGYLATLGIQPTYAATGFGYIQRGLKITKYQDFDVFNVLKFKEKPDETQAKAMLASGDHFWNSGMFIWRVDKIFDEFDRQMPELAISLNRIHESWGTPSQNSTIQTIWPKLKPETIDFGIMESASKVAVIPVVDIGWSDVGSWESLFDLMDCDENGNIIVGGAHLGIDTKKTLVYVDQEHRMIVTIGVQDLILVDTGDVLLVCHKDQAQRVRQVVKTLKNTGQDYL